MRRLLAVFLAGMGCVFGATNVGASFLELSPRAAFAPKIGTALDQVQRSLPQNIQAVITKVREDLAKLPDDQLRILNYSADPCKFPQYLNCNGAPSADVKAFVGAEVDNRKDAEARTDSRNTLYIASGGLLVSVFSLVVSAVGTMQTRKEKRK
jgi:hypothetical protein